MHRQVVELGVQHRPAVVLERVLGGGNTDDDDKGHRRQPGGVDAKDRKRPEDDQNEEVDVGDVGELEKDVFRQKRHRGILGGADLVGRVVGQRLALGVAHVVGDVHVDEHPPRGLVVDLLHVAGPLRVPFEEPVAADPRPQRRRLRVELQARRVVGALFGLGRRAGVAVGLAKPHAEPGNGGLLAGGGFAVMEMVRLRSRGRKSRMRCAHAGGVICRMSIY